MKKRAAHLLILVFCACLCLGTLAACARPMQKQPITRFTFTSGDGWQPGRIYTIEAAAGGHRAEITEHTQTATHAGPVAGAQMDALWEIIQKHKLWEWDGYNKTSNVPDAGYFSLEIQFEDGQHITATGYHKLPKKFKAVESDILSYFESLQLPRIELAAPPSPAAEIEELIFAASGAQGSGNVYILSRQTQEKWVLRHWQGSQYQGQPSVSAESMEGVAPTATTGLTAQDAAQAWQILQRNGMPAWNGYCEADENQEGGEGFYFSVTFAGGTKATAHGYNHTPPGYDAAVKDLTAWLDALPNT